MEYREWNTTYFVLSLFSVNLLHVNQVDMLDKLRFIVICNSLRDLPEKISAVSSAYITAFDDVSTDGRSLTYSEKSMGPKTDPCGTPVTILRRKGANTYILLSTAEVARKKVHSSFSKAVDL